MPPLSLGFYERERAEDSTGAGWALRESDPPPERWLQQIWRHQRLRRGALKGLDGQSIRVLHPGFWNREPGPDFRDAVIGFGTDRVAIGDVEIDLHPGGWFGHGHATNPAYSRVVLQVVWEPGVRSVTRPVLALRPFLDSPLEEMGPWLEDEALSRVPASTAGRCCGPLRNLSVERTAELLDQAGRSRLERKVAEYGSRGRSVGWESVMWEGVFGALGYKHNAWPMRRLAELAMTADSSREVGVWEARLLGWGGWLADPSAGRSIEALAYLKSLREVWERDRPNGERDVLPRKVWRLSGIRPANHPQRRLALAARWLADGGFVQRWESWLLDEASKAPGWQGWLKRLNPGSGSSAGLAARNPSDGFWRSHWTLRSDRRSELLGWLGPARMTDLMINGLLPWRLARARVEGEKAVECRVENLWMNWPAGQDNADLRFARRRLWAGALPGLRWTAARQQGLLQVRKDFCLAAGSLCTGCRFPRLVERVKAGGDNQCGAT